MRVTRAATALLIVFSVLVLAITASFLTFSRALRDKRVREFVEPLNEKASSLVSDYNSKTTARKVKIEECSYYEQFGKSMTTLLFQQCAENLYNEVFRRSLMKYRAKAVYCVTSEEMIGKDGCITFDQYNTLRELGWTLAVALPEEIPDGFDAASYFSLVRAELTDLGIPFPKVMAFGRHNYSRELLDAALALDEIESVYFNAQDQNCPLKANMITSESDILYIPYLYTSKRTPIRDNYEAGMNKGVCMSISTRGARNGMAGEIATNDTSLGSLSNIVETIKLDNSFYRSYDEYRAERLKSDTEYALIINELKFQIDVLYAQIKLLNREIINIYAADGTKR
ncbi:MAG: hypothetical protein IJU52_06985 [Clostridia bacterium]|nr:hypothetical protein [Clostridia bacterium]